MFSSFIIVLREGFESFLLVAVILSYLRKAQLKWLSSAVYVGIVLALSASAGLGYVLRYGVEKDNADRHLWRRRWVITSISFWPMNPCVRASWG